MATIDPAAFAELRETARAAVPDFYVASLLLPRALRPELTAIAAYFAELDAIPFKVSEPLLGEIRLQWWRDTLSGAANAQAVTGAASDDPRARPDQRTGPTQDTGSTPNDDADPAIDGAAQGNTPPIVQALRPAIQNGILAPALLTAMADARSYDLSSERMPDMDALAAYLGKTFGTPLAIAARFLAAHHNGGHPKHEAAGPLDAAGHTCGIAYGLAAIAAEPRRWAALGTDPFAPFADNPHAEVRAAFEVAMAAADTSLARLRTLPATRRCLHAFLPVTLARPLLTGALELGDAFLTRSTAISPLQRASILARHKIYWRPQAN